MLIVYCFCDTCLVYNEKDKKNTVYLLSNEYWIRKSTLFAKNFGQDDRIDLFWQSDGLN